VADLYRVIHDECDPSFVGLVGVHSGTGNRLGALLLLLTRPLSGGGVLQIYRHYDPEHIELIPETPKPIWRTGTKNPHTIYLGDTPVGFCIRPEDATKLVELANREPEED